MFLVPPVALLVWFLLMGCHKTENSSRDLLAPGFFRPDTVANDPKTHMLGEEGAFTSANVPEEDIIDSVSARLSRAEWLLRFSDYEELIGVLYGLESSCATTEDHACLIDTYLMFYRLYADLQRPQAAREKVEKAHSLVRKFGKEARWPRVAVDKASWHSRYGFRDSADFYLQLALERVSPEKETETYAYLLMQRALYLRENDVRAAIDHYEEAIVVAERANSPQKLVYIWNALCQIYIDIHEIPSAWEANRRSVHYNRTLGSKGFKLTEALSTAYRNRQHLFQLEGRTDSAFYYARVVNDLQRTLYQDRQRLNALEIDARYRENNKVLTLADQGDALQRERLVRYLTLFVATLILAYAGILVYYLNRLRVAKRTTEVQAEELRQLDVAKTRFFANVSHELRTPLTLMQGPIKRLQKRKGLGKEGQQLLDVADRAGENLTQLVNGILDLAKLEAGKMEVRAEPTRVDDFLGTYLAQFESLAQQRRVNFGYVIDLGENSCLEIDREKVRVMVANLLSNAFKYTREGDRVEVTVQQRDHRLHLSVADTGKGIHPDDQPYVFNRYYQANRHTASLAGGTGIGLALCQEYVRLFGGTIELESELGVGTTFRLQFPVKVAVSTERPHTPVVSSAREPVSEGYPLVGDQPGRPPGEKARLLIVEDHPDLQNYLRTILSDRYEVITAANGAIGWEILRSAPETEPAVDLILSDLMMPVMNGYELLEKAKGDPKVGRIPFVMLTARTGNEEKIRALRVGVDDYLTKPFVEEELLARVENLLRNGAIRRKKQDEWERSEGRPALSIPDQEWLTAFEDFVRREMANNHLNVSFLAPEFAMSESTLLRQLKRLTGLTPKQYLTEVRLNEARKLLEERRFNSVKRIGKEVGFYDGSRFARQFKKRFGKLPSHYL